MSANLKALIVGGGSAGVRHFRYISEYGVKCGVCDPAESCRVRKEFPDADHFKDFNSTDLTAFDVVVICTPPFLHVPQALAAAKAGCHVLLEKPLSVLSEDGIHELQELLQKKHLVGAVAFPYANMLAMDRIIEIVRSGEIGKLWSVAVHEGQNLLKYRPDYYETYYGSDVQGGGCLQDDAIHPMMGLEMLLGPELEVTCQRHNLGIKGENVISDDTAWLWLRYSDGVVATIDFSLQCHWRHNEWIIAGSEGAIKFLVNDSYIEVFDAKTQETRVEKFDDSWDQTFRRNDQNFIKAVRREADVRCRIEMARINLRAVLAARQSSKMGTPIRLKDLESTAK